MQSHAQSHDQTQGRVQPQGKARSAVEQVLLADQAPQRRPDAAATGPATQRSAEDGDFWVLDGLPDHYGDGNVVVYAGRAHTPAGGQYAWQYARPTSTLLDTDFADASDRLSALAHPVRLALIQAVLAGVQTAADLAALPGIGTSGQVYHHLGILAAAGWLRSPSRGKWQVPADRVIPLLTLVLIGTN